MKKLATLIAFALALAGRSHAQTYNLFQPANGILKGSTTTYKTSAAVASDIFGLFSGSCSSSTYLRGDGACASPPGIGTVTSVSVVSANGFAGTIANPTSTPAITLSTSITGPLKGNGTALQAAAASDISGLYGGASGTGTLCLTTNCILTTPNLGTPSALTLTNATGLPNAGVIGLGTAATTNTGTSGATIPLLNGANTWSAAQTFAGATGSLAGATGVIGNAINITAAAYGASTGGSSAANQTAIQAAITAAIAANVPLYIPAAASCYNYTAPLTINGNLTIVGDYVSGNWAEGINVPLGSPVLVGSVLCPSSNGSDGIDITGTSQQVNIHNLGLKFQTAFSGTGHGIYYVPPLTASNYQGLSGSTWENVFVYGHDGNHYGAYLTNPIYDTFVKFNSFGGGTVYLYGSTSGNYGNSTFVDLLGQVVVGGSADGIHLDAGTAQYLNLLTFVRPQVNTNNLSGVSPGGNLPTSAQYIFYQGANVYSVNLVSPDLETNVSSPVLFNGANAAHNNYGFSQMFSTAAIYNTPAWGTNGIFTPQSKAYTINDSTSSGTVGVLMEIRALKRELRWRHAP